MNGCSWSRQQKYRERYIALEIKCEPESYVYRYFEHDGECQKPDTVCLYYPALFGQHLTYNQEYALPMLASDIIKCRDYKHLYYRYLWDESIRRTGEAELDSFHRKLLREDIERQIRNICGSKHSASTFMYLNHPLKMISVIGRVLNGKLIYDRQGFVSGASIEVDDSSGKTVICYLNAGVLESVKDKSKKYDSLDHLIDATILVEGECKYSYQIQLLMRDMMDLSMENGIADGVGNTAEAKRIARLKYSSKEDHATIQHKHVLDFHDYLQESAQRISPIELHAVRLRLLCDSKQGVSNLSYELSHWEKCLRIRHEILCQPWVFDLSSLLWNNLTFSAETQSFSIGNVHELTECVSSMTESDKDSEIPESMKAFFPESEILIAHKLAMTPHSKNVRAQEALSAIIAASDEVDRAKFRAELSSNGLLCENDKIDRIEIEASQRESSDENPEPQDENKEEDEIIVVGETSKPVQYFDLDQESASVLSEGEETRENTCRAVSRDLKGSSATSRTDERISDNENVISISDDDEGTPPCISEKPQRSQSILEVFLTWIFSNRYRRFALGDLKYDNAFRNFLNDDCEDRYFVVNSLISQLLDAEIIHTLPRERVRNVVLRRAPFRSFVPFESQQYVDLTDCGTSNPLGDDQWFSAEVLWRTVDALNTVNHQLLSIHRNSPEDVVITDETLVNYVITSSDLSPKNSDLILIRDIIKYTVALVIKEGEFNLTYDEEENVWGISTHA